MTKSQTNNIITLSDGRTLGYAEYGDPRGKPVLLFHGAPGTRLYWKGFPDFPYPSGLRLIAPDRPGYGLSDYKPGQTYIEWPDDVLELTESLDLARFAVLGVSGGGPGTLACAWKIPDRLTGVGLISTPAPLLPETMVGVSQTNRFAYGLARHAPTLIRLNMNMAAFVSRRNPDKLIDKMKYKLSRADQSALERPMVRTTLIKNFQDAYQQGGRGVAQDIINQANPWPLDLKEIKIPVQLWQPEDDTSTPVAMGQYLAKTIPGCQIHLIPDAGHLWHIEHLGEVLETLIPSE